MEQPQDPVTTGGPIIRLYLVDQYLFYTHWQDFDAWGPVPGWAQATPVPEMTEGQVCYWHVGPYTNGVYQPGWWVVLDEDPRPPPEQPVEPQEP